MTCSYVRLVLNEQAKMSNVTQKGKIIRNHIKSGIKTRSNSKVRSNNCHARNMSVVKQQANLKIWKRSMSYGHRWMAETAFSSIKRMFGEHVTARKFPNMVKEIFLKATLYNMFNQMA
jgi:hypothetical protein